MFTMPYCQMLFLMICWSKLTFKVTKQVLLIYIQIFVKKKKKTWQFMCQMQVLKGTCFVAEDFLEERI